MNIALILSGGIGVRLGSERPKQYLFVEGKPVISYCLETFLNHEKIDAVQIVAGKEWRDWICEYLALAAGKKENLLKFKGFSSPGANRQLSILNGLEEIRKFGASEDIVIIHDAVRPMVSKVQISACLQSSKGHEGAMPVLPMKDTVYVGDGTRITDLLERSKVYAGQAPECFLLEKYYMANQKLLPDQIYQINGSSEPAVLAGMDIALTEGDEKNFKITTKEDLKRLEQALREEQQ